MVVAPMAPRIAIMSILAQNQRRTQFGQPATMALYAKCEKLKTIHEMNQVPLIFLIYFRFRTQLRDPHFFQNCGHFQYKPKLTLF